MRIRLYEQGDEKQIVLLFQEVYNKPITLQQWRWKYLGQGNLRVLSAVGVNDKNEIIAHYGCIPVRMLFKDKTIIACQCVDAMVKEGYRAKDKNKSQKEGIFYQLGELLYKTYGTFFYAFPGDVYRNWGLKTGHIEDCLIVNDYRLEQTISNVNKSIWYKYTQLNWNDRRIDDLWFNVKDNIGWSIIRDREFLQWRYETNPFYKHYIFGIVKRIKNHLKGWVVIRENGDDLIVMDTIFENSIFYEVASLIAFLIKTFNKKQARIWLPDRYKERLLDTGFIPHDIHTWMPNFISYKVAECHEIRDFFYYTMGDTDFL